MNEYAGKIVAILREVLGDACTVPLELDTELRALGISSLNLMKVIVRLEGAFDIEFADELLDISSFPRVADLALYVEERVRRAERAAS
jgi:acyl carrier protein